MPGNYRNNNSSTAPSPAQQDSAIQPTTFLREALNIRAGMKIQMIKNNDVITYKFTCKLDISNKAHDNEYKNNIVTFLKEEYNIGKEAKMSIDKTESLVPREESIGGESVKRRVLFTITTSRLTEQSSNISDATGWRTGIIQQKLSEPAEVQQGV